MNELDNKIKIRLIKIGIIIAFVLILAIFIDIYYRIQSQIITTVFWGILSSIVASCIFATFSTFLVDKDLILKKSAYLSKCIDVIEKKESYGIIGIHTRNDVTIDYWKEYILNTRNKLILSGRTLNRWLAPEVVNSFEKTLKRLIKDKKPVTLVIYKKFNDEMEKKEKEQLKIFLEDKIFPLIMKKNNNNFKIYEVDFLPYIYTYNGKTINISTYFKYINNDNNVLYKIDGAAGYGKKYTEDFNSIIRYAEENNWFKEYAEKRSNM